MAPFRAAVSKPEAEFTTLGGLRSDFPPLHFATVQKSQQGTKPRDVMTSVQHSFSVHMRARACLPH